MPKIAAEGAVLPPSIPDSPLLGGAVAVSVDGLDDSGHVRAVYPDGFVKHHRAETVEELAVKVTAQLRGRYGVTDVQFKSIPAVLAAGESFTAEV